MRRREVNEEQIYETVRSPDQLVQGYGSRKVAQRKYRRNGKDYLLRAVLEERDEKIRFITVYMTSKIDRYWEKDKK